MNWDSTYSRRLASVYYTAEGKRTIRSSTIVPDAPTSQLALIIRCSVDSDGMRIEAQNVMLPNNAKLKNIKDKPSHSVPMFLIIWGKREATIETSYELSVSHLLKTITHDMI